MLSAASTLSLIHIFERRRHIHRSGGHRFQIRPCAQICHAGDEQQREYRPYGSVSYTHLVEVCAQQGANVNKGDVIAYIQRSDIFA